MTTPTAHQIIQQLDLQPHIEGGHFKETYRAVDQVTSPARYNGHRAAATHIYHLLSGNEASVWHKVHATEIWHHYEGTSTTLIYVISHDGFLTKLKLGKIADGAQPHIFIPAQHWFAAELEYPTNEGYALMGCTVAPGFEYEDFMLADTQQLMQQYPAHATTIQRLARRAHAAQPA